MMWKERVIGVLWEENICGRRRERLVLENWYFQLHLNLQRILNRFYELEKCMRKHVYGVLLLFIWKECQGKRNNISK